MNPKPIKHRPETWQKLTGITVLDPDGWRRDNKSWNTPLTEKQWNERMCISTVDNVQLAAKSFSGTDETEQELRDIAIVDGIVEEYFKTLKWSANATTHEKFLVKENIRSFAMWALKGNNKRK